MIIFEPGGIKNFILVVLVVFSTGIIAWQWLKSEPFSAGGQKNFWSQMKYETGDSWQAFNNVKDSIDQGKESIKLAGNEAVKQIQQEQLIDETKKYLEDKINDQSLVVPDNKNDCLAQNGEWKKFGPTDKEECNLFTTDAGKECSDGKECQGFCFVDTDIINQPAGGTAIATTGICSDSTVVTGKCIAFVNEGKSSGKLCID